MQDACQTSQYLACQSLLSSLRGQQFDMPLVVQMEAPFALAVSLELLHSGELKGAGMQT